MSGRWWSAPGGWELRDQLERESMRLDSTIAVLSLKDMRLLPEVPECAARNGLRPHDLLAYAANAETPDGRLRLVAAFPARPGDGDPVVLCLDGPRQSLHRNPPFDNGVFGKSATLCLYYGKDPAERRWLPEHGLLGLFDLARVHVASEYEWRRTGRWPTIDAPHGETTPAPSNPALAIRAISPRTTVLDYSPAAGS